jgi:flagellar biosynthesis/type III secretory pathway protein FliH
MDRMGRQKKMGLQENKNGADEAHEKGYLAGYAKGMEDGYEKGHEEGYEQGYERGYQKGLAADDSDDEVLKDDYAAPEEEPEAEEEL